MKRFGFALLLLAAGCVRVAPDAEFLPLHVGDRWNFVASDGHEVSETVRGAVDVKGDDGALAATGAAVAGADGSEFFYLRSESGVVRLYDPPSGMPSPEHATWVLRFPLHLGSHWESWTPAGKVEFRVTERRSITAPDGSLTDGVRVDFTSLPEPIFSGHIWYARGIGPTEIVEGDYTRKLLGYRRGDGAPIPVAHRLEGLEPPHVSGTWRFGKKGWFMLSLILAMAVALSMIPRLRRPPRAAAWERQPDPVLVEEEGLLPVQAARLEAHVASHPRYADVRCKLGHVYLGMERLDDAIAQFQAALELNPKYVEAGLGLTRSLHRAKRWADAKNTIEPFARMHPGYADVQNLLGESLAGCGEHDAAKACFEKALSINPKFEAAKANLEKLVAHG